MGAKAKTIPQYAWPALVAQCIASGCTAREFGRRNGLSLDQSVTLGAKITEATNGTRRLTADGSIIPINAAKTLSVLTNKMVNAMLKSGQRAVEQLEMMNTRYEPRVENPGEEPTVRQIATEDLPVYKWAWQTCERIISLGRRDGRDEAALPATTAAATPIEPMQRAMDAAPAGMLTVIPPAGDGVQGSESEPEESA